MWPVRRDGAPLLEQVAGCLEGVENDVSRAHHVEGYDRTWCRMNNLCNLCEACMHLPYLLLIAPNVLYGACIGKLSRFPMSGHPCGPGGSGMLLPQTRRPTRHNAKPARRTSRTWNPMIAAQWNLFVGTRTTTSSCNSNKLYTIFLSLERVTTVSSKGDGVSD